MEKNYIDMHIHSDCSDGYFSVEELIEMADINDTRIISITDHDSISAIDSIKKNLRESMYGVKGIEFSSFIVISHKKYKLHILGYCFDEKNKKFNSLVVEMLEKRRKAHENLLKLVKDRIKEFPEDDLDSISLDKYCWFDRIIIQYLENNSVSKEKLENLKEYFKSNRFSYGHDYDLEVRKVIDAIHDAGGYVILAHPIAYGYEKETITAIINKLVDFGIDGIESYQSDCSMKDTIWLNNIVMSNELLNSVGSDFHRTERSDGRMIGLGINNNLCVEETLLTNKILERKQYIKK